MEEYRQIHTLSKKIIRVLPAVACLWGFALSAPAQTSPPAANSYIGSEQCGLCHTDLYKGFSKNPHYKSIASGKETPDKTGCEGCHGPGANPMAAGGGAATIRAFSQMTPNQVIDTCLSCHSKDLSRANI